MSRVVYTNAPDSTEREMLRATHAVRLVSAGEEGTGLDALPGGVYGFTYSPGLPNAPLFASKRFRSYEVHKTPAGGAFIVGYADAGTARQIGGSAEATVRIQPEPSETADVLVLVPCSRFLRHRQYAVPNQDGFTVLLAQH